MERRQSIVIIPSGHEVHDVAPGLSAYRPASQSMHEVWPVVPWYWPALQAMQDVCSWRSDSSWYFPAWHDLQLLDPYKYSPALQHSEEHSEEHAEEAEVSPVGDDPPARQSLHSSGQPVRAWQYWLAQQPS